MEDDWKIIQELYKEGCVNTSNHILNQNQIPIQELSYFIPWRSYQWAWHLATILSILSQTLVLFCLMETEQIKCGSLRPLVWQMFVILESSAKGTKNWKCAKLK